MKVKRKQHKAYQASKLRFGLMLGFWAGCALLLSARAFDLHVLQQDFLDRQGDRRNLRVEPLAAHRGVIQDRNGRPLSVSTPVETLWANPQEVLEARASWIKLKDNAVLDNKELARKVIPYEQREFVYLSRHLAPEQAQAVLSKKIPGIYSTTEYRRYYPAGEVTSHVVGFTNIDDVGQEGVELAFESSLQGHTGKKKVVRDLLGRVIQDIAILEEAQSGEAVELSIDLRAQYLAYRELLAAVKKHHATGGSIVVLDVKTGEVLAMANQPAYNPNNRSGLNVGSLRNRAVTDVFEPGSTMKPLTIAAALEAGLINARTQIDTRPGSFRVGSKTIRDHRNYGVIDITTILTKSSNVGTSKIALNMDEQQLPQFLARFGFGQATGIEFPGESDGLLPLRTRWHDIERATLSYGYGMSVTALQLAQAYAVLGNAGVHVPLSLTKVSETPPGVRVMRAETASTVVKMLESVVSEEGTAKTARVHGVRVAGKTGTVHKLTSKGYADDRYIGLFAGVAPADDPRIAVVVVIDDPRGEVYYGGQVAAPVFANVVAGVLRTLDPEGEVAQDGPGHWAGLFEQEDRS